MILPKSFTTVTPLSKVLAAILFITLPFLGFYLGMEYQKTLDTNIPNRDSNQRSVVIKIPTPSIDPTSNWKTYENSKYDYSVKYPGELIPKEEESDIFLFQTSFRKSETDYLDGFAVTITSTNSLDKEIEYWRWSVVGHVANDIKSETKFKVGLYEGVRLDYEIVNSKDVSSTGLNILFSIVIIPTGKYNYVVQSRADLMGNILASFKLSDHNQIGLGDSDSKEECLQEGGLWQKWGMDISKEYCQIPATDAGKLCTDGSECSYKICISRDEISKDGNCSRYRREFGCFSTLTNGVKEPVICYD